MDKIILVDGNNLLFRSYYATAYNGNFMKNSKGFPTNALFGFVNMINKIVAEEKPVYMIVAFDKGKTFRHDKYEDYKGGRIETPDELKMQFPIAKQLLTAMGIKYYEIDNYEADDIIGTFAKFCDIEERFIGTIISSDKDLLQFAGKPCRQTVALQLILQIASPCGVFAAVADKGKIFILLLWFTLIHVHWFAPLFFFVLSYHTGKNMQEKTDGL